MQRQSYDEDLTPEQNVALALYAIADAIRGLSYGGAHHPAPLEALVMVLRDELPNMSQAIHEVASELGQLGVVLDNP